MEDFLTEEEIDTMTLYHKSEPVKTFEQAVEMLGEWEWLMSVPIVVHPEFREQVWEAVEERAPKVPEQSRDWWAHNVHRWRAACGGVRSMNACRWTIRT
jgi:hypothetical protein